MDDIIKVLVLDNEELILETIEMFYPSDDVHFLCANSLEKAISFIDSENPIIIITNYILNEDSGKSLITKIKDRTKKAEIILLADINDFKDVLSDFGDVVSDIVYKPLDMDVLETIIKRAKKRYFNSIKMDEIQNFKDRFEEESNRLNLQIIDLNAKIQSKELENENLKLHLKTMESEVLSVSNSETEVETRTKKIISDFENEIDKEKKINSFKNEFVSALISCVRRCYQKQSLEDLFIVCEEMLKKQFTLSQVQTIQINSDNSKKINKIDELFSNNKVFLDYEESLEIPFKIGNIYYVFYIPEKLNLTQYTNFIYLFKDIITIISLNILTKINYLNQIEKEKQNSKGIYSTLANIQMYVKQSSASEKIDITKKELTKTADDIMDIIFNSQNELSKLDNETKEKLKNLDDNFNKIINEKSQNFDFISQKLSQIAELINNIELGLEGQRMKKISGDQYLFSKDRNLK